MAPDVYIQYNPETNIPFTRNLYDCFLGFKTRGHRIIPFYWNKTIEDSGLEKFTKDDILCAGIYVYKKVLEKLQIKIPEPLDYPKVFMNDPIKWFGRLIGESTLGKVRDRFENPKAFATFIKPKQQKIFTGFVVERAMDLLKVCHINDECEVWTSDQLEFLSEYRVYVNKKWKGKSIIGIGHYNGDPCVFPDVKRIQEMIELYKNSPVAYSLDVGVTRNKKTVIIETNNGNCLGNYCVPSPLYADFVETAWNEVVGKKNV